MTRRPGSHGVVARPGQDYCRGGEHFSGGASAGCAGALRHVGAGKRSGAPAPALRSHQDFQTPDRSAEAAAMPSAAPGGPRARDTRARAARPHSRGARAGQNFLPPRPVTTAAPGASRRAGLAQAGLSPDRRMPARRDTADAAAGRRGGTVPFAGAAAASPTGSTQLSVHAATRGEGRRENSQARRAPEVAAREPLARRADPIRRGAQAPDTRAQTGHGGWSMKGELLRSHHAERVDHQRERAREKSRHH